MSHYKSHSHYKNECCPDYYKKCYTKEDALHDIECKIEELIDCKFLTGISIGLICDNEIVYNQGFGVRNKSGDLFTEQTHVQLGDASFFLLAIYLSYLAELNLVCSEDRLIDLGYQINNNRATEISASISDIISGSLGYTFNNTKLSWLLCHEPEEVKNLLACRIFNFDFISNLLRNKVLKFFGANNYLVQSFLDVLATNKLGGGKIFEKIKEFLETHGFANFGYGTQNYLNEENHADGCLRRECCWESIDLAENVNNYEASVGAYANTTGLLELTKLLLNNGKIGETEILKPGSLRQWFRHTKTRVKEFDQYCDTEKFPIPEINVSNAGTFKMCIGGANFNFYSGFTTTGLRALIGVDLEQKFGVTIVARCKTVFPEALMGYAFGALVAKDRCLAEDMFNFLYRLFNPYLELQMSNIKVRSSEEDHDKARRTAVDIPLDGLVLNSCEGKLEFKEEDECVFAKFGNCPDYVKLFRTGLDNYIYLWKDRSGLEYQGQLQVGYNYDQSKIEVNAGMYRRNNILFKEEELASIIDEIGICDNNCIPLPPIEEKNDCCYKPCKRSNPDYHNDNLCKPRKCCDPCCKPYKLCKKCCYYKEHYQEYCEDKEIYFDDCHEPCYNPCKPYKKYICYDLIEEPELCLKKRKYRTDYDSDDVKDEFFECSDCK